MESAAFVANKVKSVTVLGRSSVPFENILGKDIGQQIADLFKSKGVNLIMNSNVEKFVGENGKVTHVVADGQSIPADICITGLGVKYGTEFLKNSGISLTKKGSIDVNEVRNCELKSVRICRQRDVKIWFVLVVFGDKCERRLCWWRCCSRTGVRQWRIKGLYRTLAVGSVPWAQSCC